MVLKRIGWILEVALENRLDIGSGSEKSQFVTACASNDFLLHLYMLEVETSTEHGLVKILSLSLNGSECHVYEHYRNM